MPALLIHSCLSLTYIFTWFLDCTSVWGGHALLHLFYSTPIDFFSMVKKRNIFPSYSSLQITVAHWFIFFFLFTLCKHSLSRVFWKCQRHHGRWVGHTYFILSDTCSILCQPPRLCLVPVRRRHEKLTVCTLPKYHVQSHRPDKWNHKIDFISMSYETSWVTRRLLVELLFGKLAKVQKFHIIHIPFTVVFYHCVLKHSGPDLLKSPKKAALKCVCALTDCACCCPARCGWSTKIVCAIDNRHKTWSRPHYLHEDFVPGSVTASETWL